MRRLTSFDAQFISGERRNAGSHYTGLAFYEDPGDGSGITAERLRWLFAERLDECPPLSWVVRSVPLNLDHPVFERVDPDLEDHITEVTLPAGAGERAVADAVAATLELSLDRSRPLWKVLVVHGMEGRTAVAFTMHHAIADGISARDIYSVMLEVEGQPHQPEAAAADSDTPSTSAGLLVGGVGATLAQPFRAARKLPKVLPHLDQVPPMRAMPGTIALARRLRGSGRAGPAPSPVPRTRFNVRLAGPRAISFGSISLDAVKRIKNAHSVTVNDVVVALIAGALRRRLQANDELPNEPLVAFIPTSVRPQETEHSYGNAISAMIGPLPTHLDNVPERIRFATETMSELKARHIKIPPNLLGDVNDLIPPPLFPLAAKGLMAAVSSPRMKTPVNLTLSNIPGSPLPLSCLGMRQIAHYPHSLIFDGVALNITVVSYLDKLDVGIVGDAKALPDAWEMIDDVRAELEAMEAEVVADGVGSR